MLRIGKIFRKYRKVDTSVSNNNDSVLHYEICIICGHTTGVLMDTPIEFRENYIYGCGQLCERCSRKLRREMSLIDAT